MQELTDRFTGLYQRWINGSATPEEVDELALLLKQPGAQRLLSPLMKAAWEQNSGDVLREDRLNNIALSILNAEKDRIQTTAPVVHRPHFLKTAWFRYAAAIIIAIGIALYFQTKPRENNKIPVIARTQDVAAPSSDQATLTLADGRRIIIDGTSTGQLATEGKIAIQRNGNGEITYNNISGTAATVQYNTLSVPRGGRMATILLSDGSKVYLNSGSSIKYPVQFLGNERRVDITGEAFFEVAPNPSAAFVVSDGKTMTQVLGTSFNVHAYPDETDRAITLISGAVKVIINDLSAVLKPGQQCSTQNNTLITNQHINTDEVIAWKNGYFHFENATLDAIAKEVSRWYNVDFIFENKHAATETFHAKFSRNSSLSTLLTILELSDVKVEIKGNEVIIK